MKTFSSVLHILTRYFPAADGSGISDVIHEFGRASDSLLYAALYVPDLVEENGSVLLKWSLPDESEKHRFRSLLNEVQTSEERERLEASFNFVEVGYLFGPKGRNLSDDEDSVLAELLATAWNGRLAVAFPRRKFVVEVLSPKQTGSTVGVHFFERR